jgi:beta-galactosidase
MHWPSVGTHKNLHSTQGWKFQKSDVANAKENNFSDASWTSVNLPHTWNVEDPWDDEPGYYRGAGWYRRELIVDRTLAGKHLFLYFEGANQVTDVYVNGQKVGSHIGGYSAFSFDITQADQAWPERYRRPRR